MLRTLSFFALALCSIAATAGNTTESSTTPSPRHVEYEWMNIATWYRHHANDVEAAYSADTDVVFTGDSITESWDWNENYKAAFQTYFGQYKTVNLGVGGDQTQNLIWRLQNGAKGKLKPKAVVLMIGVNNLGLGAQTPEQTAAGVNAVITQLHDNFPEAEIIVHAILPYDEHATSPNRDRVKTANALIQKYAKGRAHFYDFGEVFLDSNGSIPKTLMEDFLHPTPEGMALLGEKLQPIVKKWAK